MQFFSDDVSEVVTLDNTLKWEKILNFAEGLEKPIVWDLKIDPFSFPIANEAAFKSLVLNINTFNDTVYSRFEKRTKGVILYQGSSDFPIIQPESQKRVFTHKQGVDHLKTLSAFLPDSVPIFLLFDKEDLIISETCYDIFCVATKESLYPNCLPTYGWERESPLGYFSENRLPTTKKETAKAFLLPPLDTIDDPLFDTIHKFLEKNRFKVIPEAVLTENWEGVETLFLFPKHLTQQGKRYVAGFEAAGGLVLEII